MRQGLLRTHHPRGSINSTNWRGEEDTDTLVLAQDEQIAIPGQDDVSLPNDCGFQDLVVAFMPSEDDATEIRTRGAPTSTRRQPYCLIGCACYFGSCITVPLSRFVQ